MNNISVIKENCYGCFSCFNICPNNAIEMIENADGFKYPSINNKCTNCGLCKKVCPLLTNNFNNSTEPKCIAFMAEDNIRAMSSSGGVFPVLAKYFIEHDGYVAGAVYNDNIEVEHIISNKIEDIEKMRISKYFQSNMNNCYAETKRILDNSHLVLFTGTPCQIAGLKSFLRKDYENLYCADIICHGVPSPKVFRKYIYEKFPSKDEIWLNTNFRDKSNGLWSRMAITTTTTRTTVTNMVQDNVFMKAFLSNICLRPTCTNCKFQTIPRQGDITMGDFWGIGKYDKNLNDEKGTSVVLNNNQKGDTLSNILKENAKEFKYVPLKYAIQGNPCLTSSADLHNARNLFFKILDKYSLNTVFDICNSDKVDYIIVNFWHTFNYGASLTAWAMQTLIESFGYNCMLLNRSKFCKEHIYQSSFSKNFADKFLNLSKRYGLSGLKGLSKNIRGVILGSDQVLRLEYIDYDLHRYLLNWVENNTKKIALSASFGIDKEEFLTYARYTKEKSELIKNALKSFDYLSCREISGQEIYKDVFDLNSDWLFDPVFLIDKEKYNEVIKYSNIDNSNNVVSYVLDDNQEYDNLYKYILQNQNSEVVKINNKNYLVEDWLKSICDCKFLITDSFHGVCFALIFNKPFICIRNKNRGNTRFDTLIEYFNISENFVYSIDEIYQKDWRIIPDFKLINEKIIQKRCSDLEIIKKVLAEGYSNNPVAAENKMLNIEYLKNLNKKSSGKTIKILKLKTNYYRCKILANIVFGAKRKHYTDKKKFIKEQLKEECIW